MKALVEVIAINVNDVVTTSNCPNDMGNNCPGND